MLLGMLQGRLDANAVICATEPGGTHFCAPLEMQLKCYNIVANRISISRQGDVMRLQISLLFLAIGTVAQADSPKVAVDIAPVHGLVAQVMEGVDSPDLVIPPGANPHGYAMRPSEAAALAQADIVFWVGPILTPWMAEPIETLAGQARHIALSEVDDIPLLDLRVSARFEAHDHDHDHGREDDHTDAGDNAHDNHGHDEHAHADDHGHADAHKDEENHSEAEARTVIDGHMWLNPEVAALWVDEIARVLSEHDPENKPYAVVQLRQDNALGTLYNMVGFQTKLKYGEQTRIFKTIPALENAEFARLGGLHRNTYLNSPQLLDEKLSLKGYNHIRFAGQITGCEGYIESASIGILAARFAASEILGKSIEIPPITTAMGALLHHITTGHVSYDEDGTSNEKNRRSFQPMNVNFGLFPPIDKTQLKKPEGQKRWRGKEKQTAKKRVYSARALEHFKQWLDGQETLQAAE